MDGYEDSAAYVRRVDIYHLGNRGEYVNLLATEGYTFGFKPLSEGRSRESTDKVLFL